MNVHRDFRLACCAASAAGALFGLVVAAEAQADRAHASANAFNVVWTLDDDTTITRQADVMRDALDNGIPRLAFSLNPASDRWAADATASAWRRIFSAPPCANRLVCASPRAATFHLQPHPHGLHVGAAVRVGEQGLGVNANGGSNGWYAFAGADAQALRWDLKDDRDDNRFRIRDTHLLGDVQAGLGRSVLGGDLSIGYVAREVSHMGASRTEQFGGVTFGWSG